MGNLDEPISSAYVSPRELAQRWQCSRASVSRIARRAGISTVYLGDGKNGMVRYSRKEVENYETRRRA